MISDRAYSTVVCGALAVGFCAAPVRFFAGPLPIVVADATLFLASIGFLLRGGVPRSVPAAILLSVAFYTHLLIVAQLSNPNVLDLGASLRWYRPTFFFLTLIGVGFELKRRQASAALVFSRFIPVLLLANVFVGILQVTQPSAVWATWVKTMDWGSGQSLGGYRVTGMFPGGVQYALGSSLLALFGLVEFLKKGVRTVPTLQATLYLIFGLAGLVLSLSRMMVAASALVSLPIIIGHFRHDVRRIFVAASIAAIVGALALGTVSRADREAAQYLVSRYQILLSPLEDRSFRDGRIERWNSEVLPAIRRNPAGLGLGSTGSRDDYSGFRRRPFLTESSYFTAAIGLGWLGGSLFLFLSVLGAYLGFRGLVTGRGSPMPNLILLLFFLSGLTTPNLPAYPLNVLVGLSFGFLAYPRRATAPTPAPSIS